MPPWVRGQWAEEDITFFWEVREDGWVSRSVEAVGPELRPCAAAAFDEVIDARDTGDIAAVQAYEARYGLIPEKPIDSWDFPHGVITVLEFEEAWTRARTAADSA